MADAFSAHGNQSTYQCYHSIVHRSMNRRLTGEYVVNNAFQGIVAFIARRSNGKPCWTFPRKSLMWGLQWFLSENYLVPFRQ
jgi:hypothetical protein